MNRGCFKKGNIPWNKGLGAKIKSCKTCFKDFLVPKFRRLDSRGKFCSWECRINYKYKIAKQFKITPHMAELIGVIIGDGCIDNSWTNKDAYRIFISGNPVEDKLYMDLYLPKLIRKCLGKNVKPFIASNGAYVIQFSNEPFRLFLFSLGIKPNKSKTVKIPNDIKSKPILLKKCIKGIGDTDFTVIGTSPTGRQRNSYPRITTNFASKNLVKDLEESLRMFGFTLNIMYNKKNKDKRGFESISHSINLDGSQNLNRWIKIIGFANLRIITRYKHLQKFGYLSPKTTLPQRMKVLGIKEVNY